MEKLLIVLCLFIGCTPVAHTESRSPQWKEVRSEYIQAHPECEICSSKDALNVHHIYPYHLFPEKELDVGNLITLCRRCHFVYGHKKNWNDYDPNVRRYVRKKI